MRSSALVLAVLLQAATGWSDTEDWSYEEWSEGWQHGAGSAQEIFYTEGPRDIHPPRETQRPWHTRGPWDTQDPTDTAGSSVTAEAGTTEGPLHSETPSFAIHSSTQLISAVGHNITFHCPVLNIGEKLASWVRSRDLHLLACGDFVFSSDTRVSATRHNATRLDAGVTRHDSSFNLTIAQLRLSDAGKYECQLNTEPKMSLFYHLTVLASMPHIEVWVSGGGVVREGDEATFRCAARSRADSRGVVSESRGVAATHGVALSLRWYKDGEPIDLQSPDAGGVLVESGGSVAWRRSVLRVRSARVGAAGRYECRAAPHAAAHTHLSVIAPTDTEVVEGMQRDEASPQRAAAPRPVAPPPRAALALSLAALLLAFSTRALLLHCTHEIRQLHY